MKIALAVYTALFFLIYLYGIYARLGELDQDLRGKGHRRTWGGMAMALCSGLMFVSSAAWIGGWAIGTSWLWRVLFVAVVGSMLWTPVFVRQMQADFGPRVGLYGYLLNTLLMLPLDVVLFVYAFRSPAIWAQ